MQKVRDKKYLTAKTSRNSYLQKASKTKPYLMIPSFYDRIKKRENQKNSGSKQTSGERQVADLAGQSRNQDYFNGSTKGQQIAMTDSNEATLKSKNYFGSQYEDGNQTLQEPQVTTGQLPQVEPKKNRRKKSMSKEIKDVLQVNRLQPSRLFQGLGEDFMNASR